MAGRRDGPLMKDKDKDKDKVRSRIVFAIVVGVTLGCVFAFLYPHGLFSADSPIQNRRFGKSDLKVRILLLLN